MSTSQLAIYGGPPAVNGRYRERWRQMRIWDAVPIVANIAVDRNTVGTGTGPIAKFERRFAAMTQSAYALTMNSGTATLHSAFFAVGVKPGDEVIVPAYTWFASAAPILQCGATPVFCDIDQRTLTADPDDVQRRITPRTRAICVVHIWGNPAAMDRFVEMAARHRLALIEDCSHAHGATYQGQPVGSFGDVGCFSLQGAKAVSGGEAGVAVTNNPVLFDRMLAFGHNIRVASGQAVQTLQTDGMSLGLKYRPHLYAIILADRSLSRLQELNTRRQRNYRILSEVLDGCHAVTPIGSYPEARRGGFLEFILRYCPGDAGHWNVGAFAKAAAAEGVPIMVDRYTRQGPSAALLHKSPIFSQIDYSVLGAAIGGPGGAKPPAAPEVDLPVTMGLTDCLLSVAPMTKVSETFVRQCALALRKVAQEASRIKDLRSGR